MAASPSTAAVYAAVMEVISEYTNADSIVEIVIWLSVFQLL
jgi:hypothetical protein